MAHAVRCGVTRDWLREFRATVLPLERERTKQLVERTRHEAQHTQQARERTKQLRLEGRAAKRPRSPPVAVPEPSPVMTAAEQAHLGYFNVERILGHRCRHPRSASHLPNAAGNGPLFRVKWEHHPESEATWEPLEHLRLPDGTLNSVLMQYCKAHGRLRMQPGMASITAC